ncbi:ribonuclease P protein component [Gulosibacter macacae]|uniref:ribonuclease P protein component n=1 Tax=Gulosibacter macacae TaxID=2488791 RepID=UPI00163A63F6|nr:ribonuclease P protein component [Gulosibacter macacae]
MLARANRITQGSDYRRLTRAPRVGGRGLIVHGAIRDDALAPTRFGFIITKRVGVAVVRNTLRRRLKAITRELLTLVPSGLDFVIRVHPEAVALSYEELRRQTRRQLLEVVQRVAPNAIPEQCSCSDVSD